MRIKIFKREKTFKHAQLYSHFLLIVLKEKRAQREKEKASDIFKEKEPSAAEKKRNAQKKRLEDY